MRNINVLNVLLLAVIIALAAYILPPLLEVNVSYTLPAPKKAAQEKEEQPAVAPPPSMMEYTVIAEQNVFNPERKIPAEKADEKPLPKPEFVLYGTLIAGDTSMAFMEDLKAPYTTAGRGKRQRTLRVGGVLSGYTLSQVYTDRVVLLRGEESMEVRVMDSHKKARGTEAAVAGQAPPARTPITQTLPSRVGGIKPQGAGLPPGIVKEGTPPQGQPSAESGAAPLSQVKEKFDALIKQKMNR
ncbi:MAG: hypothetical protein M1461_07210 [Nitrospirae bacterium]|nr:hypothetical protein [Nitrospirota bacterium]